MHTTISADNPFGCNRYGYLWEMLGQREPGRHLDYGAYDGRILCELDRTAVIAEGVGLDANTAVVAASQGHLTPHVTLTSIEPHAALPFTDEHFDSVGLLDVLEHVVDQIGLLEELHRVLRPDGLLVVTTPKRYALSFLDTGNWKFRFPRLHQAAYSAVQGRDAYRERYVSTTNGLCGDLEVGKEHHDHFSVEELIQLLASAGFDVVNVDGSAYWNRVLVLPRLLPIQPLRRSINVMIERDARRHESANLFMSAVRR